jgi:hypothetical protein
MNAMRLSIAGLLLGWMLGGAAAAQDAKKDKADVKTFSQLTTAQTEDLLKKRGLEFKKVETKDPSTIFYDFKRHDVNVRLTYFGGKDLMLDVAFPGIAFERINEWNRKAKFSRASLIEDVKGTFAALESNIDLIGGVTEGGLVQFFVSFDDDLRLFMQFVSDSVSDRVYAPVAGQKLEAILKGLNIVYEKSDTKKEGHDAFTFDAHDFKVRLVNFGGKDLMIDAQFKKIPLEDVNRWNLEKKFIRAVAHKVNGKEYTALEMNLDCEAGTTDGILRNFIIGFHEDVRQFAKYVREREPK